MLSGNIERGADGALRFAGFDIRGLAKKHGTPLYLMDEARIRQNCRMYTKAFQEHFGEKGRILYASTAASFKQMSRIAAQEGIGVDAVSAGEIRTALAAGYPAEKICFHGNGKTAAEIRYGLEAGVGCFVVDNTEELELLSREAEAAGKRQKILIRVTPGIDTHSYAAVNTGLVDSKFGFAIETGQAE